MTARTRGYPAPGQELTTDHADEFLEHVAKGATLETAAEAVGYDRRAFYALAQRDDEFAARFATAKQDGLAKRADRVDDRFDKWIEESDCAPALRIVWAKRWNPAYREAARMELTGRDGGPLEVSHPDIAEALERFTTSVVSLAERGRAELASGEPQPD